MRNTSKWLGPVVALPGRLVCAMLISYTTAGKGVKPTPEREQKTQTKKQKANSRCLLLRPGVLLAADRWMVPPSMREVHRAGLSRWPLRLARAPGPGLCRCFSVAAAFRRPPPAPSCASPSTRLRQGMLPALIGGLCVPPRNRQKGERLDSSGPDTLEARFRDSSRRCICWTKKSTNRCSKFVRKCVYHGDCLTGMIQKGLHSIKAPFAAPGLAVLLHSIDFAHRVTAKMAAKAKGCRYSPDILVHGLTSTRTPTIQTARKNVHGPSLGKQPIYQGFW